MKKRAVRKQAVLFAGLTVGIGCVVAAVVYVQREIALPTTFPAPRPAAPVVTTPPAPERPVLEKNITASNRVVESTPLRTNSQTADKTRPAVVQPPVISGGTRQPITEAEARTALSRVGADADAEGVWITAINDPNLSANARQNLIEDLNEDGLSDPRNPTADDLPLIVNRLQLIEDLAPDAMDQVNWDAFLEAYKDLVNMYNRLTQR